MRKVYSILFYRSLLLCLVLSIVSVQGIQAQTPQYYKGTGTGTNTIPMNTAGSHTQQIYTPTDFNTLPISGLITKIYFRNAAAGASGTYINFSISFLQNNLAAFPNSTFLTGFTPALSQASITINGNATAGGWYEIPLATPFMYDNTQTLIVEIKYDSRTGGLATPTSTASGNKRLSIITAPGPATGNLSTIWGDFGMDVIVAPPCVAPPTAGTSLAFPSVPICTGTAINLSLTGHSQGPGQAYVWQSSSTVGGTYTDISSSSPTSSFVVNPSVTTYYRCAVTCSGNTQYSTPVQVMVNPALPAGTYSVGAGGNYQNLTEVAGALACGIAGPVVFNFIPGSGPYTEQVTIPQIGGTSATNTITFNGNGVTIQATPVTATRHIIKLDGADYIIIKNFNILAQAAATFGWGVHLTNGADHNVIDSCTIDISAVTSTTLSNSAGIVASGSTTSVTTAGSASYNTFSNNTITGAYTGIIIYGTSSYLNAVNNKITKNIIRDFYGTGITIADNDGAEISYNDISRANRAVVSSTFLGVEISSTNKNCIINANRIHDTHTIATTQSGTAYGIYTNSADAPAGSENKVINNLLYNFNSGTGTIYALYNSSTDGIRYYHNTIVLDYAAATAGVTRGFYQATAATGIELKNNIFYIARGGTGIKHCLYFGTTTSTIVSNKNVLYNIATGGTNGIGTFGTTGYTLLSDWQGVNGNIYDQQSVSLDPLFLNSATGDYTPSSVPLNDIGLNVGVATDILNAPRNITNPDPGAYEFNVGGCTNPPTPGTAISSLTSVCSASLFTLDLSGNSIGAGQTYQWQSGPGGTGPWTDAGPVLISPIFSTSQTATTFYRCAVKCGAGTTVYSTSVQVTSPALVQGNFTINSSLSTGGTNFQTFADAVNSIRCGISGPVVFRVLSGTYNEQLVIPEIYGASATNTITFKGSLATLSFNSTDANVRAGIQLNGADHIIIDSLIIDGSTGTYGWGVHFMNKADSNTVSNCIINTSGTATSINHSGIVFSSSVSAGSTGDNGNYNLISKNTINGGIYGVYLAGNSAAGAPNLGNIVRDNKITDTYSYGINITYQSGALISGNEVTRPLRTNSTTVAGVFLSTGAISCIVQKNSIHNMFDAFPASTSTCYGIYVDADAAAGQENKIINNLIYNTGGNGTVYGIYNTGGIFMQAYYNTISLDDMIATTGTTYGIYQTTVANGIDYKNNVVSVSRSGTGQKRCIYFVTITSTITSNNNVLLMSTASPNNFLGQYGTTLYATLADWKTSNAGIYDQQSVSIDPLFANPSVGDYKPTNNLIDNIAVPVSGITTDIAGATRDALTPDPGAYEFSTATVGVNMSAEALVTPAIITSGCYSGSETVTIRVRNNSTGTINFVTTPVTVTVNITGAVTQTLTKIINTGTLASNATMDVVMTGTLNMSTAGVYTFNANTTVAGDANPANDAMLPVDRTSIALSAGTAAAYPTGFCITGGIPTVSITGATGYSGLQWQQSTTSGTGFSNILSQTGTSYTPAAAITQTMYYRVVAACGATTVNSPELEVSVTNPLVLTTTPGGRCGPGTVTLGATANPGSTLSWYSAATGGSALGTGSSFVTPVISTNTTYYVGANGGSSLQRYHVGYVNTAGYSFITQTVGWGAMFTANLNCTIDSVYVYPTGTGTVTIKILDPANNVLFTGPTVNISGTGVEKVPVQVGAILAPGSYKMGMSSTGVTNLGSQPTGSTMAYPFVSVPLTITSGSQGTGAVAAVYYWFYDWVVSTGGVCESTRSPVIASVQTGPSAAISYVGSPFCNGSGTATVSQTGTTGGTYSSTAGLSINSTTGAIDLTASSIGSYTVTYTVAASGSCPVYQTTTTVNLSAAPSATISYAASPYCSNGGTANVTRTGSTGGTYSSTTGLSINATTGAINLNSSTAGTYTVTYDIAASGPCPSFTTTAAITINAAPAATISYVGSPFCNGPGTVAVIQTGTIGGTYSSTSGLSINSTTGTVTLGTSTPGTYTVTYTIPAANGCVQFQTTTPITISTAPSATISYAGSPYCSNGSTATVTRTGSNGGVYSSTTGLSIDPATGAINIGASTAGTYTVTYAIAAAGACPSFSTTTNITITAAPSATISYTGSPYCSNAGVATITRTGSAGGTYSSTTGLSINATTGAINLGASLTGTYTVTYTIAAASGCAQYQVTTSITITSAPNATISYAASPYCANSNPVNITQTGTTGGIYSSTTGLSINATTGAITPATSTTGTYTVTYTIPAANGCSQFQATTTIIITPAPTATISYTGSPYCTNSGVATVTQTGTTGGTYSSTTGLSINATTGAITPGTSTPGTYTVTYTIAASSGCAQFQTTASVIISPAPAATISYPGSPFCVSGGVVNVTRNGTAGGVFSSTTGLSINATTGAINLGATTPGTYTITYTVAATNGCAQFQTTTTASITGGGTWLGGVSNDWNNASNWCGGIPTSAMDVTIPSTAPNMPNLSAGNGAARNIFINNGASLTIGNGGALSLYGNITGGGAFNASAGSLVFRGVTPQTLPGFTATNVTMNGAGGITPGGNVSITGALTLTNGSITLGANNISLSNTSTGSMLSHIITNGTGQVTVANLAATQTRTVPVGSDAVSYNPVTLTGNTGHVTDNITVRVQQGVYENGTGGVTFTTHVADRTWIINEATAGGSNVNLLLQWNSSQELPIFDRTRSYVMQYNGTEWVRGISSPAGGTDPYTQVKTNVTSFSPFAVETQRIPRPTTGIYPNPTPDYLNVVTDLLSTGPVVFSIFDHKGSLVYRRKEEMNVGLNLTKLDVRSLAGGMYVLRVTTRLNQEFLVQVFIKSN